jgi:hypothetical protein
MIVIDGGGKYKHEGINNLENFLKDEKFLKDENFLKYENFPKYENFLKYENSRILGNTPLKKPLSFTTFPCIPTPIHYHASSSITNNHDALYEETDGLIYH